MSNTRLSTRGFLPVSILYLRCAPVAFYTHQRLVGRVSILYLRCREAVCRTAASISLFTYSVSILYLRCPHHTRVEPAASLEEVVSILYLRCRTAFFIQISLFGLPVSILYLRCRPRHGSAQRACGARVSILYLRCRHSHRHNQRLGVHHVVSILYLRCSKSTARR